jgi:hypothetical protein
MTGVAGRVSAYLAFQVDSSRRSLRDFCYTDDSGVISLGRVIMPMGPGPWH